MENVLQKDGYMLCENEFIQVEQYIEEIVNISDVLTVQTEITRGKKIKSTILHVLLRRKDYKDVFADMTLDIDTVCIKDLQPVWNKLAIMSYDLQSFLDIIESTDTILADQGAFYNNRCIATYSSDLEEA